MTPDPSPNAPEDRFCDLVMKGGIASGVVYPKAIARLAAHYRFQSIGGTSAGAIAAAVTAAAEYQRRQTGSLQGFELLRRLPEDLGESVAEDGSSRLLSLFQPQPKTRRLFQVLIGALNSKSTNQRILAIVAGFISAYWLATLAGVLLAVAFGGWIASHSNPWIGLLAALPLALVAIVLLVGIWVYHDLSRNLVDNGFGLCTGRTESGHEVEALTPWLHGLIQEAAGRNIADDPLTFGDLWGAKGFPPSWLKLRPGAEPRSIDLRMFTTNLAHGRPYIFPLDEGVPSRTLRTRDRFLFRPEELTGYLPSRVMWWLRQKAEPYRPDPAHPGMDPDQAAGQGLYELPAARDLPILLAARMSLSFPLLFSAVPLWAVDYDVPHGRREFRRCWFSDGGISSNFPVHLFDGLLPMWPTFGISLEPKLPERDNLVYVPRSYRQGFGERWNRFDGKAEPISRLGGFLSAIVATMQNWNDNALSRMPGVRDRIARVRLQDHEGGMNLNMEDAIIDAVAERGLEAAVELLELYAQAPPSGQLNNAWDEQRLVRLNVLLKMIEVRASGVVQAIDGEVAHATRYGELIERLGQEAGPGYDDILTPEEVDHLHKLLARLKGGMAGFGREPDGNPFISAPQPELRVRPPL
jgi:predicted acylesterase/phospholipase RssA